MKNNKNSKREKRLIITPEQAKTALSMFLQHPEKMKLEKGIAALLEKLKNPGVNRIFDNYPDLLQQYDLEELLSGNLEIPDTKKQEVKTAGILSCLQVLIYFCYDLERKPKSGSSSV
ncbi:hypothetical protein [Flavobacterium sp. RS13.1]|uniref:hypothetical protein n=1 Tax=Flavobacterium sp. RS13.1 TaxID=3400345 RepID=UPI003AAD61AA